MADEEPRLVEIDESIPWYEREIPKGYCLVCGIKVSDLGENPTDVCDLCWNGDD